jgi:hypothetical protein
MQGRLKAVTFYTSIRGARFPEAPFLKQSEGRRTYRKLCNKDLQNALNNTRI